MKMPRWADVALVIARKRHVVRSAGWLAALIALLAFLLPRVGAWASGGGPSTILNQQPFADPSGYVATYNSAGNIDTSSKNLFFASLGTNGRTCATCHVVSNAMGLSVANAQEIFAKRGASDPLFAMVDGANCPTDPPSLAGSHSLLLNNGLIRIALTLPPSMQFTITPVHDPYGCALVTDPSTGIQTISVYRRPLPATNLNFLSAVMFDGRETVQPLNSTSTFQANLVTDLTHQALDATLGHAQAGTAPTSAQLAAIVNFELGLHSAQVYDNSAGWLTAQGAQGGAYNLSRQSYYPGINDVLGGDPTGAAFNSNVFTIFAPWLNLNSGQNSQGQDNATLARKEIAAGEQIFDTFPLTITVVRGLNDNPKIGATLTGTCSTCHDAPGVGDHSLPLPLDIGTSHSIGNETNPQIAGALSELNAPDLPIFEIDGCTDPFSGQIEPIFTSDPGKALLTGKCVDVNRIKGPILRGLAARAPYFHNGAAATLDDVVNFYNQRFQMNLTDKQKLDLVAFLKSL